MLQIDSLHKSLTPKLQYPEKKIKVINPTKKTDQVPTPKVTLTSENMYNAIPKKYE